MTAASSSREPVRVLVINPNTTEAITALLPPLISSLPLHPDSLASSYFTCPKPGIPSINSPDDSEKSAEYCLPHLIPALPHHDAFLVACYSHHPLVGQLQEECLKVASSDNVIESGRSRKYVTGIFEASVLASLSLLQPNQTFGIVSTGKVWETALPTAVHQFLGSSGSSRFVGCETTGLNADQLHDLPEDEVKQKMMEATKRLLRKGAESSGEGSNVGAICLGCAGMVGLDSAVRTACIEELGESQGNAVHIVDGVVAGILQLHGMATSKF
jgi:Asp/Glu/hydantoin racemase